MKICIETADGQQFTVSKEDEAASVAPSAPGAEVKQETESKQTVGSLQEALMLAGKMLQSVKPSGPSPFDEGMKSTMPNRSGQSAMGMM
jgi:hypothetical protein